MKCRLLLITGFLLTTSVWANPYTQPKGDSQLTVSAAVWKFDTLYDGQGNDAELPFGDVVQTDFILGFEHGISDRLTLLLSLPWSDSERDVPAGFPDTLKSNDGVGDAIVGLKWRLNDTASRTAYAILINLKWPGEYEPDIVNSQGDGNFDSEVLFSIGHQFSRASISADLGYRARSGNPDDEWVGRLEGSFSFASRFVAFTALEWVDSQGGLDIDQTFGIFAPYSQTEEDYLRLTGGGYVTFTSRVGGFLSVASAIDGSSTAKGIQYATGLAFTF